MIPTFGRDYSRPSRIEKPPIPLAEARAGTLAPGSSLAGALSSEGALLNSGEATSGLAVHSVAMHGPVTIADLIRDGKLLEIGCLGCGRHVYVDAASVGLPNDLPVPSCGGAAGVFGLRSD